MEPTARLIGRTLGTLASLPTQPTSENALPIKSPVNVAPVRPCRTAWQRKWLCLDVIEPAIQQMADEAEAFAGRWYRNRPSPALLVLTGPTGTGKTHTAEADYRFARHAAFAAWEN